MANLPSGVDIYNLIDDLRICSWEAADILIYYAKKLKDFNHDEEIIKNKDKNNPVTIADLEVNDLIIKRIKDKYKDIDWEILSEENVKGSSNICYKDSNWIWVLDPLDGTKDFIQGTGNYAMHLSLNFKTKPFLGVVLIPEKNELWISNGKDFWCENRNGSIKNNKISNKRNLRDMTLVSSKNHRNETLRSLIEKINFKKVIQMGSIGCKVASIIRGESDIYISLSLPGQSSPKDWDFASPEAILRAAGGAITNLDNEELKYNSENFAHPGIIIASNNKNNHRSVCNQVKEIVKRNNIYPV